jgi:hypothetical protein
LNEGDRGVLGVGGGIEGGTELREVVGFAQAASDWKIGKPRPLRDANYAARDWSMVCLDYLTT